MDNIFDLDPGISSKVKSLEEHIREKAQEHVKAKSYNNGQKHGNHDEKTNSGMPGYRFELLDASALPIIHRSPYLVKNIIPTEGLVVVWGPPKCGKSFWILDLAFHIALGWEYRGHRVKQGLAVYICCEGAFSVPARIEAFRQNKICGPIEPNIFKPVFTQLDLAADVNQLIDDVAAQLGELSPAIIVIDTLNRSLAGSESSDEDMGAYIKAADKLRTKFGCAVAIIHHCGYDATHPRGHTSLLGAADAQIAVKKDKSGLITTRVEYLKDGPEGETTESQFKVIDWLALDDDGEPISSCVLEPAYNAGNEQDRPKKEKPIDLALKLLKDAIARKGKVPPADDDIPAGTRCVTEQVWREYFKSGSISVVPEDAEDAKKAANTARMAFNRAAERLLKTGQVKKKDDWVWIVE